MDVNDQSTTMFGYVFMYGIRNATRKQDDTVTQLHEFDANHSIDPPDYVK